MSPWMLKKRSYSMKKHSTRSSSYLQAACKCFRCKAVIKHEPNVSVHNTRSKMCCCHVGFHKTDSSSFASQFFSPCIVPVSLYPILLLLLLFLLWLVLLKHLWNQFSLNIYCSHSYLTTSRIIKESTAILSVFLHLNIWPWVGL